jgi:exodeoxyribonuclease V alpha subunit
MVLGDICGRGRGLGYSEGLQSRLEYLTGETLPPGQDRGSPVGEHIAVLQRSYRFAASSGIGALANAVNAGDGRRALEILEPGRFPDLRRLDPDPQRLPLLIRERVVPVLREYLQCAEPAAALHALNRSRVLCAVRAGPHGVNRVNRLVEEALAAEGLIPSGTADHYPGRPVIVTENDYDLELFNGDVGLLLRDPESGGQLRAFFEGEAEPRRLLPTRLPRHETLYATTVHKSQGSEFDQVFLLLPEVDSPVLTRELLYTAVTRARARVTLIARRESIEQAARTRVTRSSGLFDKLWGFETPA